MNLTPPELRQVVWNQLDIRVSPIVTEETMHQLLNYEVEEVDTPVNIVELARISIMEYIRFNKGRLSLPCDGNCYNHADGIVLHCYAELLKEKDGQIN